MGITLLEYAVARKSGNNQTGTTVSLAFGAVPNQQLWRVDQIAVGIIASAPNVPQGIPPSVLLYDQSPTETTLAIQGSDLSLYDNDSAEDSATYINMWADWDDQSSPLTILGGDELTVVFLNVSNGAQCLARVQYGLYQGTSGTPTPVAGATPAPAISAGL